MKNLIFQILYICLGVIAVAVRLGNSGNMHAYMCTINQIAGFVTILVLLFNVLNRMLDKIKKREQSKRRCIKFIVFSSVIITIYWIVIILVYKYFDQTVLNDLLGIVSLTLALTSGLFEGILLSIFYKG